MSGETFDWDQWLIRPPSGKAAVCESVLIM